MVAVIMGPGRAPRGGLQPTYRPRCSHFRSAAAAQAAADERIEAKLAAGYVEIVRSPAEPLEPSTGR